MGWSGQRSRAFSPRTARRLALILILAGVALVSLWLGIKVVRAYQAARQGLARLETLQESLRRSPQDLLDNFSSLHDLVEAIDSDMQTVRAETSFFDPLLTRLDWIPRYGPELAATPHLTALAADISGGAADLAQVGEALLPVLQEGSEDSLARAIAVLQEQSPALKRAHARLQQAAYERTLLDPTRLDDGPYERAGALLSQFDAVVPPLVRALAMLDAFLPQANSILGMDAPCRYLILGQNNSELRATGGFLGSMGPVTVDKGRVTNLDYRRSYDWDSPNRDKVQPPFPYVRYMRFGAWFIRDANWYADFPTSAQTVESFWQLDGHEAVAGVIAIDLHAVQDLLEVAGPVDVPGYGVSVSGPNVLETIWEEYRRDPGFLSAMTGAAVAQLQKPETFRPERLPALLQALHQSLEEKHLLLYFNDPVLQQAVVRAGWSGAIRDDPGDFLMVVDSDFSFAEVNPFIEETLRYHITLDRSLEVQESTVTLSYWNHFDQWSSAETRERFGGACFDPATEDLRQLPGCYGDYIRLYVPRGSRFIKAEGFDAGMEYREESGRTVIAGYVRVLPGEQRTVAITYAPPAGPVDRLYRLTLQKQPGTDALPVEVEVQVLGSNPAVAGLQTDLRNDRVLTARLDGGQLVLSGEGSPLAQLDPQSEARQKAFAEGLALWDGGQQQRALARWREAAASGLVLERVNLLLAQGNLPGAEELVQAGLQLVPDSAQAYFLLGKILLDKGDTTGGSQALEKAVALDPENRAARKELGLFYEAQGNIEGASAQLQYADRDEVLPILWQRVWQHFNNGEEQAGINALNILIRLTPDDTNARFTLAFELQRLKRYDEALQAYDEVHQIAPSDPRFYVGRSQVYAAQGLGDQAIADLEEAVQIAPRTAFAWYLLGSFRMQFRQDAAGAVAALEQAVALDASVGYVTQLGNVYLASGNVEAAVATYERAVALPGHNASTWSSLAYAYQLQERWDKAVSAYTQAVALEPGTAWIHASLAYAYERTGEKERAIAEYEAALALQPGQAEWLAALERLK